MSQLLAAFNEQGAAAAFKSTKSDQHFCSLFKRHRQRLYSTALRILGSPDDAEEIVQETFIKALHKIEAFKTNASLSAWLYAIAHNLCMDALRLKQKSGEPHYRTFDPQSILKNQDQSRKSRHVVNQITDRLPNPAEQLELTEEMQMIIGSLMHIPNRQRIVMLLRDVEGLSYEAIATSTGTNIGTVRSRLHYGRLRLKKILCPYFK